MGRKARSPKQISQADLRVKVKPLFDFEEGGNMTSKVPQVVEFATGTMEFYGRGVFPDRAVEAFAEFAGVETSQVGFYQFALCAERLETEAEVANRLKQVEADEAEWDRLRQSNLAYSVSQSLRSAASTGSEILSNDEVAALRDLAKKIEGGQ